MEELALGSPTLSNDRWYIQLALHLSMRQRHKNVKAHGTVN